MGCGDFTPGDLFAQNGPTTPAPGSFNRVGRLQMGSRVKAITDERGTTLWKGYDARADLWNWPTLCSQTGARTMSDIDFCRLFLLCYLGKPQPVPWGTTQRQCRSRRLLESALPAWIQIVFVSYDEEPVGYDLLLFNLEWQAREHRGLLSHAESLAMFLGAEYSPPLAVIPD